MTTVGALTFWLLRRSRTGLAALLLGVALFEFIQPIAVDSFGGPRRLEPFLELIPPSFLALLNVSPDFLSAAGLPGYLSLGFNHPVYLIMGSATVVWLAARGLAGEMERGTIQFALARPISRPRVYASRVLTLVIVCAAVAAIGPLGMLAGLAAAQPEGPLDRANFLPVAAASALLLWAVGGVTLAASARADTLSRAVGWGIGWLVLSYVIDYFAAIWSALEPLEPFSVFSYYDPALALAQGELPADNVLVLLSVGLVGIVAGLAVFVRRDLPT